MKDTLSLLVLLLLPSLRDAPFLVLGAVAAWIMHELAVAVAEAPWVVLCAVVVAAALRLVIVVSGAEFLSLFLLLLSLLSFLLLLSLSRGGVVLSVALSSDRYRYFLCLRYRLVLEFDRCSWFDLASVASGGVASAV
jgi:hypothetical protein